MELMNINNSEVMTSIQIAELTGKRHANVMRDIKNIVQQLDNQAELNFELSEYKDSTGKSNPVYLLTKKGSLCLAAGYNANLRMKIIDRWEQLESQNRYKIPKTLSEALLLAAKQTEKLEAAERLIEENKPKVEFYDTVTESLDVFDMRTVAAVLDMGVGRNKIFAILRMRGVFDSNNKPYQQYIDRGYFRCVESVKTDGYYLSVNVKTVVYQKGLDFIRKILKEELR